MSSLRPRPLRRSRVRSYDRARPDLPWRGRRRGLTLVELIVALALFTGAVLTLAASSTVALRLLGDGRREGQAVTAARAQLEAQLAVACPADSIPDPPIVRHVVDTLRLSARGTRRTIELAGATPC